MSAPLLGPIGPLPREQDIVPYEVCVFRTRTGEVVDWIPLAATPIWERGLNISGSWSAQPTLDSRYMTKDRLNGLIDPWYWSWAIVQRSHIHQAGPVMLEDYVDGDNHTTIHGVGIWTLFKEKRVLIKADRASLSNVNATDADMCFGPGAVSEKGGLIPANHRDLSLHTIAKRLVQNELAKPGSTELPIDFPADIAGGSVREFLASELAYTGNRLFEMTQVIDGPEIMFVPYFSDGTTRKQVRYQMMIGNSRLGQLGYPHYWVSGKAATRVGFASDGVLMCNREWDRGSGFDRNVITGFAEDLDGVTSGAFQLTPLLESVGQLHTQNGSSVELDSYAAADVQSGQYTDLRLSVEVTMDGDAGSGGLKPSPSFESVSPGDTGVLWVSDHPRLRDGRFEVRVIKMGSGSSFKRGSLTTEVLGFQPV